MSESKPVFVFVPGGWHVPDHYKLFIDALEARGYKVVPLTMPSTADETPSDPVSADIQHVADTARSLSNNGEEVVIIGHSCGGVATSEGAAGLGVRERAAKGLPGGVRSLVFVSAMVRPVGAGMKWGEHKENTLSVQEGLLVFHPEADLVSHFYHDVAPEYRPQLTGLRKHPLACVKHTMKNPAYREVNNVYIYCDEDGSFTPPAQKVVVDELKDLGIEFSEASLPSGHFPFLSMPEELIDKILELA